MTVSRNRPESVKTVQPMNVSTFTAVQWVPGDIDSVNGVDWLAERFGWKVTYNLNLLSIYRQGRGTTKVQAGHWVVSVGAEGSYRVESDKNFQMSYRQEQTA